MIMSKILIIGNVLKDVYLKLDDRRNHLEKDDKNISWMELGFNGEAHPYFHRTSVYGGAAVSLSVLGQLGVDAGIMGSQAEFQNGELSLLDAPADYRYILCNHDDITYFVPSARKPTEWIAPSATQGIPEWIFVDRSTTVTAQLVDEIANFMKFAQGAKLAVHAEKHVTPAGRRLMEMADVLFLEEEPAIRGRDEIVDKIEAEQPKIEQIICHITPRKLVMGEAEESWSLERTDTLTHLTVYSTIAATILGVISAGGSVKDALLWARLNAETTSLKGSATALRLQELAAKELEKRANIRLITRSLMTSGKGILAADESDKTLTRRFAEHSIKNSPELQRDYRTILFTTSGLKDAISGVILSGSTVKAKMMDGTSFVDFLTSKGIIPGVKVDEGLAVMPKVGEDYTLGLEGLAERLRDYYKRGLRFAKWRSVFRIGKNQPSFFAVERNAEDLATFAKECQLAGMVPMIEPEVLRDGDFGIEQDMEVTARVLAAVFQKLEARRVELDGLILKCNMVMAGKDAEAQSTPNEVGMATAAILRHAVPRYVAGVCLLSGGQEPKEATQNLTAVEQNSPYPWPVTFAFARAFQEPVLKIWQGKAENVKAAQAAMERHLTANVDALHYGQVETYNNVTEGGNIGVLEL